MKDLKEIKKILIKHKKFLKEKYDIINIKVFGSYTKNKVTEKSDIDLIVKFRKVKSLMEIVRIEREISQMLNIKVDLLTEKGISPFIIEDILKEAKYIFK
mgnify:CR=1 FL=1